mgnify:CR=1 FL=1
MPAPSTACLVQDRLGLTAPAMDVQAACAGFVYALVTAASMMPVEQLPLASWQTALGLGEAERRRTRRDDEVAAQHQLETAAEGVPLDRGDQRLRALA